MLKNVWIFIELYLTFVINIQFITSEHHFQ